MVFSRRALDDRRERFGRNPHKGKPPINIVLPPGSNRRRDRASREEYNDLLAFYRGADFDHDPINEGSPGSRQGERSNLGDPSQLSRF